MRGVYLIWEIYDYFDNDGNGKPWINGNYKNGKRDGVWQWSHKQ